MSTESFARDWLALRAPADARARNPDLARRLQAEFAEHARIEVLDLGAGTGNNMRAVAHLLPREQHWRLADHDAALLAHAIEELPEGVAAETVPADLSAGIGALLSPAPDLVTTSAFLDLCGEAWLDGFAEALASASVPFYAALSYDGRETWMPYHPDDSEVLENFHTDQRRDKGFGPSLGPAAHGTLVEMLRERGFHVIEGRSDWELEAPRDSALIAELARGTAAALGDVAADWGDARQTADGVFVGHRDLLAFPPD